MTARLTQKEAEKRFKRAKLTLLSEYRGNCEKVRARCHCNTEFFTLPKCVFRGTTNSCGCLRKLAGKRNRLSQAEVKKRFQRVNLTLLSKYRGDAQKVLARCHCGKKFYTLPGNVSRGGTTSCGCYRKKRTSERPREDITNKRFGMLVALEPTGTIKQGSIVWKCRCDCGDYTNVTVRNLRSGHTTSCKCTWRRRGEAHPSYTGHGEMTGAFWNIVTSGANKRKRPLTVTPKYCWELFLHQERRCALSGVELVFGNKHFDEETTASLDRIDSSKGYSKGNIHWIHKTLNISKAALPPVRFLELCRLVVKPIRSRSPAPSCTVTPKGHHFKGYGNVSGTYWRQVQRGTLHGPYKWRQHITFRLSIQTAWEKFLQQNGRCALTGLELDWGRESSRPQVLGTASLDRIDSSKGYTASNIQWVHKDINRMKSGLPQGSWTPGKGCMVPRFTEED